MATNGDTRQIQLEWRWQMFNLDKKFASVKLVADAIKTLGDSFDVISKAVLQNKQDIKDLKARVKLLEMKGKQ